MSGRRHAHRRPDSSRSGIAILSVLLVLLALLVLTAPFLMTARNASRSSAQAADRAQASLALDAAERHARAALGGSHPSVDPTPYFDDAEELDASVALDPEFVDAFDTNGVMWDVRASDVAARIDLASAPPHVFANMLGASTRLIEPLGKDGDSVAVSSTRGFAERGLLQIGRELVAYTERGPQSFGGLTRGVAAAPRVGDEPPQCGPSEPEDHPVGEPVLDQRAFAPVEWRNRVPDGVPRVFDAPEQLAEARLLALGGLSDDDLDAMRRLGSVHAGVAAGRQWQRAARVAGAVRGGDDCVLVLDRAAWFSPGTTVRISDGKTTELGIVLEVDAEGVQLMEPLANDYHAYTAEVRPLARRPVNVNLADAETLEVLFANVQREGVNSRLTRTEARALAARVIEARPFTGLEDLLTRVLLPAAGIRDLPTDDGSVAAEDADQPVIIDPDDALAAYQNALNPNSSRLAYGTMPFSFTSRDVFELDLRAAVNASSGIARTGGRRNVVQLVAPQQDLLRLFARQEDFDEALRLDREAPWWATGPSATSRWDGGTLPPSRFAAHVGTYEGQLYVPGLTRLPGDLASDARPTPTRVFASREEDGWAQLWPSRVAEVGERAGKVLHFDHETRDPEGRYLPDESIVRRPDDEQLEWVEPSSRLLRCLAFELWFKPRDLSPGVLFDLGAGSLEADRVTLELDDQGDLVLSVLDAMGDHGGTQEREAGEARYSIQPRPGSSSGLAAGPSPGLPADVWTHVSVDVRGNRPDQITMRVDGRQNGVRQPGLTRLGNSLAFGSTEIVLESGEGFPERGVVKIGREWIEYRKVGPDTLDCSFSIHDEEAPYTGGRFARVPFTGGVADPVWLDYLGNGVHEAGTPVELAGYTKELESAVSSAAGELAEPIGAFRVARVEALLDGNTETSERIVREGSTSQGLVLQFGTGLQGRDSEVTGLRLVSADDPDGGAEALAEAFHTSGGFAVLVQAQFEAFSISGTILGTVEIPAPHRTESGDVIGGVELIQYGAWDGDVLPIVQRAALPFGEDQDPHAFVTDWTGGNIVWGGGWARQRRASLFVVPISIPVGAQSFPMSRPDDDESEFAQITHRFGDFAQTEWVRYDLAALGHLVRTSRNALTRLSEALTLGFGAVDPTLSGGGGGGGGPGSAGGGTTVPNPAGEPPEPPPGASPPSAPAGAPAAPAAPPQAAALWDPYVGAEDPDEANYPISRAAASVLQFRGVFGTFAHAHEAGAPVLPAFRVGRGNPDVLLAVREPTYPGRKDPVLLLDADPEDVGFHGVIHHTWRPVDHPVYTWSEPSTGVVQGSERGWFSEDTDLTLYTYVALEEAFPVVIAPGRVPESAFGLEARYLPRMMKFPSGERPRIVDRAILGGDLRGSPAPAVVIDEVVFGAPRLGTKTPVEDVPQGAPMVVIVDFGIGATTLQVASDVLSLPPLRYHHEAPVLRWLHPGGGLLRIDSEILCYSDYDADSGALIIPEGGRGLLGTIEEHHEAGARVHYLEDAIASTLAAGVPAGSDALPLVDVSRFPFEGTVLVGDELIHYTRVRESALEMPRASRDAGAMDRKGEGLFRGRYGTDPAAHGAGTPVVLFPFRYWDREAPRADAPELAYFGLAVDQPGAFWRSMFFEADELEGLEVYALQRAVEGGARNDGGAASAPPWDADPAETTGLDRFESGRLTSGGNPLGFQADRLEWRFFVRYAEGAFDAQEGLSHAWKQSPRLELFGVEYLAPNQVLRRVDE